MTSLGVYPVMLKKPALAYRIGKSGCVASDTTNVCWNVESASLTSRETFGRLEGWLASLPASDASDVLMDAVTVGSVIDTRPALSLPPELPHHDSYVRPLVLHQI